MKELRKDPYTERLLEIYKELVKKRAIAKKKDFTDLLGTKASFFSHIETRKRNFPSDETTRDAVRQRLFDEYYVNPEYMQGKSIKMFVREPDVAKVGKGDAVHRVDFAEKKSKDKLARENETLRERVEHLRRQVNVLEEQLTQYGNGNPDTNPDN